MDLFTELDAARKAYDDAKSEEDEARKIMTDATNRLNAAQKAIDQAMGKIRADAPWNTDWHSNARNGRVAVSYQADTGAEHG